MPIKNNVIEYHNPFNFKDRIVSYAEVGEPFVNWLQKSYPKGFTKNTVIYRNQKELSLNNYDVIVEKNDVFVLTGDVNAAAVPVIQFIAKVVAVAAISYGVSQLVLSGLDIPEDPDSLDIDEPSSTYNLRAQSNTARVGEPIPVQYGRMRVFPDLAATPYVENTKVSVLDENDVLTLEGENDEQFLYQVLCLGQGYFDIEEIRLGDTDINDLRDAEITVYEPNTPVTAFHTNVFTLNRGSNIVFPRQFTVQRVLSGEVVDFSLTEISIEITGDPDFNWSNFLNAGDFFFWETFQVFTTNFIHQVVRIEDPLTLILTKNILFPPAYGSFVDNLFINNEFRYAVGYNSENQFNKEDYQSINGSESYISSPVGTIGEAWEIDTIFEQGLYDIDSNENIIDKDINLKVTLRKMETDSNDLEYVLEDIVDEPMQEIPVFLTPVVTSFNVTNSEYNSWDNTDDIVIKNNGVVVPETDIDSIELGDDKGDARVNLVLGSYSNVTFSGKIRNYAKRQYTKQFVFTTGTTRTLRQSFRIEAKDTTVSEDTKVVKGRYLISIERNDPLDITNPDIKNVCKITGIKSYLEDIENFGPYTFIALKLKATRDINRQNSKKFNVIATRKLPIWDGDTWSEPTATRSIAWATADAWMSTYGASRSYLELNLDKFLELDAVWASRGDTFDGVFDQAVTVWEGIQKILRVGRARAFFSGTTLTLDRDEEQTIRTAFFSQANMVAGTFKIEYIFQDQSSPDGVNLKYLDEDSNFTEAFVKSDDPNITSYEDINLFGCVNYEQAWRETQYLSAQKKYLSQTISFDTELDGSIPLLGDLITVSHDLASWGTAGYVTNKDTVTITTDEPLDFSEAGTYYIAFRKPDGTVSGPHVVTAGADEFTAILDVDVTDFTFITVPGVKERTYFTFGLSNNWTKDCIITKITPKDEYTNSITAIPYIQEIYDADTGTPAPKPSTDPSSTPIISLIGGLLLTNQAGTGEVICTWNPVTGLTNYVLDISTDNVNWTNEASPTINAYTLTGITGTIWVRVAGQIDATVGDYTKQSIVAT